MTDRILVVDQNESLRDGLMLALSAENYEVTAVATGAAALAAIESTPHEIVFCELEILGRRNQPLVEALSRRSTVIAMAADDKPALDATALGAYAILNKPFENSELLIALRQAREREQLRRENRLLRRDCALALGERPIVAASTSMIDLLETLERASAYESTVLLTGERGTGKEVLARAIHSQSPRRRRNFVSVHCGAMSEQELAAELFGHIKGAFPGADRNRPGLFSEADGGTFFLDEVSALPEGLQADVLGILQDEEVRPLGAAKARPVNVRILAATSRRLDDEVKAGRFLEDLLNRLNAIELEAPSLRERRKDIPLLVDHFISRFQRTLGSTLHSVADDALERLVAYHWPGNIRELENVIECAMITASRDDRITLRDLPARIVTGDRFANGADEDLGLKRARRALEADVIRRALSATGGNRTHAAKRLEISHRALLYKLKEYGIRD